ncbi:MAG TPA: DUF547 domain-containing protein [Opitutaceae bacterium]
MKCMIMRLWTSVIALAFLLAGLAQPISSARAAPTLQVPASMDHSSWDALLKAYVDDQGLVDYAAWKASPADLEALDRYIGEFAATGRENATGVAEIAALINAYNAITIRWMLDNYPTPSIRETSDSWKGVRWSIGGRKTSLDEIEHKNLRPLYGWKVHATIVCAARSCPPLQREAYTAGNLEALTAQAYTAWLGRPDLNRYDLANHTVHVSPIFKWFKEDFTGGGALARILEDYGPAEQLEFFSKGDFKTRYLDYHWGINDQGKLGEDYSAGLSAIFKSIF